MPATVILIIRLLLAVMLGGLLGWEREREKKPAGLRTIILVTFGSCLFTILSLIITAGTFGTHITLDPARIAAGIVTGIGFLGAGAIIRSGGHVEGLTTAAVVWTAAAIGMAVGFGYYTLAVAAAIIVYIVLRVLIKFEKGKNE